MLIAWGRVKLRINITRVFRICRNCQSREATRAISANAENTGDINPYFPSKHAITWCPRRVLAQTAKTRGGTLEAPAYREKNIAVPEKNLDFREHSYQRIAQKYAKDCRKFTEGRISMKRILGTVSATRLFRSSYTANLLWRTRTVFPNCIQTPIKNVQNLKGTKWFLFGV